MQKKLSKGFDINIVGNAAAQIGESERSLTFALKPTDFYGMRRPKPLVEKGDTVKAGTPILFDKKMDKVMYTAPVSGEVVSVKRGAKRKLLEISILADKEMQYEEFETFSTSGIANLNREKALDIMLRSGVWPQIVQRPFGVVADPDQLPKAIFISCFDTHPLAPDYDFLFKDQGKYFQAGVDVLWKVIGEGAGNKDSKEIYVATNAKAEVSKVFSDISNVKHLKFGGPHPAGNVGVHIHHTDPINKGEIVWTINPFGVIQIGKLFLEGKYDASKLVALVGPEVKTPQYYKTYLGACIDKLTEGKVNHDDQMKAIDDKMRAAENEQKLDPENAVSKDQPIRYISGNALTGQAVRRSSFLGFYDHQLTVLTEGNEARFFLTTGWFSFTDRLSFHRALGLMSFLSPKKARKTDTNLNGEERAFVMSGAFEKVVPMDILPTHLIKAVMSNDYDEMEALGIYEIIEEDLALCEFIDVSKHEIQKLIREGLDDLRLNS